MKKVFVVMNAEFLHPGHINIIKVARDLGEVTVGLATDDLNARYKRLSVMSYEQRKSVVENIMGVERVIPQDSLDLSPVLRELKPDYFVHGDDWVTGRFSQVRERVLELLKEWGGVLVEPPYTAGISSTKLNEAWRGTSVSANFRRSRFRRLLEFQPLVRMLEVHNGLSGAIVEHTAITVGDKLKEFDAMWLNQSTASLSRGIPVRGLHDPTSSSLKILDILGSTTKPLILELDGAGEDELFIFNLRSAEGLGVSAVCLGGGQYPDGWDGRSRASMAGKAWSDDLADKISIGKRTQATADFSIIACIRDPGPQGGIDTSLHSIQSYIDAGADAILLRTQPNSSSEVFEFARQYTKLGKSAPLIVGLPGSSEVTEEGLFEAGVRGFVYLDCLLRASYSGMLKAAESLLVHSSSEEVDRTSLSVDEICNSISGVQG